MLTRLLVPLDGTPEAISAVPTARALALAMRGEITLIRVVPPSRTGDEREREDAEDYLKLTAGGLAGDGLQVHTVVRSGTAADEIVEQVSTGSIDLVVMATHGRAGITRALLGSVAERVLTHCPVPLLPVSPSMRPVTAVRRLVVPVDGSPGSVVGLAMATEIARTAPAEIVVVEVVAPLIRYLQGRYIDPQWEEQIRDGAQAFVDNLAQTLRTRGISARGRAEIGPVARTIASVAQQEDADLLVMSTHALTGPARTILGSVADEVLHVADRPVLLVPPGARGGAEAAQSETQDTSMLTTTP